jgi:hypothetical protein
MKTSVMASLPGKLRRASASAASVPSTIATAVASSATRAESAMACRRSDRSAAAANQRSVKPWGGKLKALSSVLKA